MKIIATTSRLFLREFEEEDAVSFFNLNKDQEVIKYTGDTSFTSINEAKLFIKNYSDYTKNGYGRWAICLTKNKEFIGFCGLKFHPNVNYTEIGFRLFKKYWNHGYATESAKKCIEFGFSNLNLKQIYAHVHVHNYASQHVIKKCGLHFVKEFMYDNQPTNLYCINSFK